MNESEFKKQLIAATARHPEQHIPHQAHEFPPDFASRLMQNQPAFEEKELIAMQKTSAEQGKPKMSRFRWAGIAAAAAVCVGLNGALIYGISKMKQEGRQGPGAEVSVLQNADQPHMELINAMPTAVTVKLVNPTDSEIEFTDCFYIQQNGEKIADCSKGATDEKWPVGGETISPHSANEPYLLSFEQLPAGQYTLCSVWAEGESQGTFGSLTFEISADFDNWIYVPDCEGRNPDELIIELTEKGLTVETESRFCYSDSISVGDVIEAEADTEYGDGRGYWLQKGETVTVIICSGKDAPLVHIPDITGWDYETARDTLLGLNLMIDKRHTYTVDVPEGKVIEASVNDMAIGSGGMDVPEGTYVNVMVSLGIVPDTVPVPSFVGMDWEMAKQTAEGLGILLSKELSDGVNGGESQPPGTVVMQGTDAGEEIPMGSVVQVYVMKDERVRDIFMNFPVQANGAFRISVFNDAGENIGNSCRYLLSGTEQSICLYAESGETDTPAHAILYNCENGKEAALGNYILHPDSSDYETVFEGIAEAFRQVSGS